MARTTPVEEVRRLAREAGLDPALVPRGYERYSTVLVVRLPREVAVGEPGRQLGAAYAKAFGVTHVVADVDGSHGELRQPQAVRLFGDGPCVAEAREADLVYRFDPTRVMFSSGNHDERLRVRRMPLEGLHVVDLFAGIGYYAVPAAKAGAAKIWACERNPESFAFLRENVEANGVARQVEPRLGDCREVAPPGVADLVVMGYLQGTWDFLPTAFRSLKPEGGRILFHENVEVEDWPHVPLARLDRAAQDAGWRVASAKPRVSKSFAPFVDHVLIDLEVRPK